VVGSKTTRPCSLRRGEDLRCSVLGECEGRGYGEREIGDGVAAGVGDGERLRRAGLADADH